MLSIAPFDESYVGQAAVLFANRYARLRESAPLLPAQYESVTELERRLTGLAKEQPGFVALDSERVVGYLAGFGGIPQFKGKASGVYVPVWGHAVADAYDTAVVHKALYAACSVEWIQRQWHTHAMTYFVPDDALAETLYGMGFGMLVIDAMRPMQPIPELSPCPYAIRTATAGDLDAIASMDAALCAHLRSAPVFLDTQAVAEDKLAAKFMADDRAMFIAWDGDQPVAGIRGLLNSGAGCDLFDIDGNLGVTFGYTIPEVRRTGVATHVLDALLRWGKEQGMQRCTVDFESANLHARGFWERHFQPICHSAIRRVDDRL